MARRYRYAFAKRKESKKGKYSVVLAVCSALLFPGSILLAFLLEGRYGFLVGTTALFAAMLAGYGFLLGLRSFSDTDCKHRSSMVGSILNGIILIFWLALFLSGRQMP